MERIKIILAILLILSMAACTNGKKSYKVLENEGYKNIRITGWKAFKCSEDDLYSTGFEADNANNKHVSGTVCGGGFKGYTIRID